MLRFSAKYIILITFSVRYFKEIDRSHMKVFYTWLYPTNGGSQEDIITQ